MLSLLRNSRVSVRFNYVLSFCGRLTKRVYLFSSSPSVVFCTKAYSIEDITASRARDPTLESDRPYCDGCSFESRCARGFVCTDKESGLRYVSSSYPLAGYISPVLVKQSCVRSLSCEVYPQGREGVIYFGDEERGHVLSYCFVLKDSQARGFQRTYSFLIITRDKESLMSNWSFFTKHIETVVQKLKEKASSVHDKELRQTTCQEKRSMRLDSINQVGTRGRNPFNTQRSSSKARSLAELTNDNGIFATLHQELTWILKANSLNHRKVPLYETQFFEGDDVPPLLEQFSAQEISCSVRWLYTLLGREKFRVAAYHAVVGHQVIIRSKSKQLSKSCLISLSQLLPKECIKATFDSNKYEDAGKCNLLTLHDSVQLPSQIGENDTIILIDIVDEGSTCKSTVHSRSRIPDRLPKFLADLERVIQDTSFSDSTLIAYLIASKQEWLNKSKLAYAFTRDINNSERWDRDYTDKLYKAIDAQEADISLLNFWLTGLPIEFKASTYAINEAQGLHSNSK